LLNENEEVFVIGLDYEQSGLYINMPQYKAPELWSPNIGNIDYEKVVMFSLGVVLYYWHTGRFPFKTSDEPIYNKQDYPVLVETPNDFWAKIEKELGK
jgi:serine/threonine protein kinase